MAEGFEKEFEKGKMPDKYKDLMEPKEMQRSGRLVGHIQEHLGQYPEADQEEVMLQPKLKSKVRCTDLEIGEVTKVMLDPLSHEISHIVVSMNGSGERQVAMGHVQTVTDDARAVARAVNGDRRPCLPSSETTMSPRTKWRSRISKTIIHVTPGEVLVPLPELEKSVKRRTFFMNFTHVIGFLIGLPIAYPILRFLMKPMYAAFDNEWLKIGNVEQDQAGRCRRAV